MIDFGQSWDIAEKTCFDKLREYIGGSEGVQCFRGYLPSEAPGVWTFTSGNGTETQIGKFYGTSPCFGGIRMAARAECQYGQPDRSKALTFGMQVLRMLNETGNMHEKNNVQWLRLVDMPQEPVLTLSPGGHAFWVVQVPLEMIFATTTNYNQE